MDSPTPNLMRISYKGKETLVINLNELVMACPRTGDTKREGEQDGVIYTSFVMTRNIVGESTTLDSTTTYDKFQDIVNWMGYYDGTDDA